MIVRAKEPQVEYCIFEDKYFEVWYTDLSVPDKRGKELLETENWILISKTNKIDEETRLKFYTDKQKYI